MTNETDNNPDEQDIIDEILECVREDEPVTPTEPDNADGLTEPEDPAILAGDRVTCEPFPMPSSYGLGSEPQDMPFEFRGHIDPKLITGFLQGIGCTVDEAKIMIDRQGWHVKTVDPAHVCMSEMHLLKKAFINYKCLSDGSIGLDIDKALEVCKAAKKGDSIGIIITESKIILCAGVITREISPIDTSQMSEPEIKYQKEECAGCFYVDKIRQGCILRADLRAKKCRTITQDTGRKTEKGYPIYELAQVPRNKPRCQIGAPHPAIQCTNESVGICACGKPACAEHINKCKED